MGRKQSWDNAWDVGAMSNYNTITSLAESPVEEGLIYAGTDDGFIQVSENGGDSWRKIPVTNLGLAPRSFVNDIKADLFDVNTVYVALDNHKEGDYNPYLFKTSDYGKNWESVLDGKNIRGYSLSFIQDPIEKKLLFLGTENGLWISIDEGNNWVQFKNGFPSVSTMDLVIQENESALVIGTFGRAIWVLDLSLIHI